MKKSQAGFAPLEMILVLVVLVAIAGAGYFVMHNKGQVQATNSAGTASTVGNQVSPPTTMPPAPQVTSTSDLSLALKALNQTNVDSSSLDSGQLTTQSSGF